MNIVSFASFDNFDKQTNFSREPEKEDKPEDFSSILGNIFSTLQTTEAPSKTDSTESVKGDSQLALEIPAGQTPGFDKTESDNKLPELPGVEPKILAPDNSEPTAEVPVTPTLWAGTQGTIRRPHDYKTEFNLIRKAKAEANQLFQAEIKPKSVPPIKINNDESLPPTQPIKTSNDDSLPETQAIKINNDDSLPETQSFQEPEIIDIISIPASDSPKINLKPQFEGNKLKGFDITPNEVHSILKTFDKFFKNSAEKAGVAAQTKQELNTAAAGTFQDISKSIKESFGAIIKDAESSSKFKDPYQSPDIWWDGQNTFDNTGKGPVVINNQNLKSDGINEIGAFKFEDNSDFSKAEKAENNLNIGIKFDKFLGNVSNEAKTVETPQTNDVNSAKVLEQINPRLLELAALTAKKQEKQVLKMRLHPAELGTVEIKLERNSSGSLNAYFKTETDGARQALTQNLEQLRDSLQNAGWQIGQMEITNGSFSSTADQHRGNNPRQSEPVENYNFSRSSDKPDELEQNSSNRLLSLLA